MRFRSGRMFGAVVSMGSLLVMTQGIAEAQTWTVPRTSFGQPDLQGVWNFATITPLERPRQFAGKETLTATEATAHEAATAEQRVGDRYYWDRGTRTVRDRRTALIVDPADGRVPSLTPAGRQRFEDGRAQGVNGTEERNPSERCITRTVPRLPGLYNNNFQIFQTPTHIVILMEMIHEARIIPLGERPHASDRIRQWLGDSRGHRNPRGRRRLDGTDWNLRWPDCAQRRRDKGLCRGSGKQEPDRARPR